MAADERYPLALPQGTILAGQYIIECVLGQGGFGITYRAVDHKTGQKVAVKEFFPDSMATRTQTTVTAFSGERGEIFAYGKSCFLQEAETLAEFIGNENIVKVHSYFEENGTAYFVMDFVEGTSFDNYIKEHGGRIRYEEAEKILLPVMDALAAVHSRGIVHRDVTPDNIYITKDGTVKLLDFGAARYSLGDKSRSLDVVLKHGFAPKEQYTRRGKQGPFTDVYTVGASFYFAVTGRRPPDSIDRMDEDDLIPPSNLGVAIPSKKEDTLLKAMSVQPTERFQTMTEFKQALLSEDAVAGTVGRKQDMPVQPEPQPVQQKFFMKPEQQTPPEPTVQQIPLQTEDNSADRRTVTDEKDEAVENIRRVSKQYISSDGPMENLRIQKRQAEASKEEKHKIFKRCAIAVGVLMLCLMIAGIASGMGEFRYEKVKGINGDYYVIEKYVGGNTVVEIPSEKNGIPVREIGKEAFEGCDSLINVTIPDSVTLIGRSAFHNCGSLASVTIPDSVTEIGDAAFGNCNSLASVTIPDSVTEIGERAFAYCDSLTSITIPKHTVVAEDAFEGCPNLTIIGGNAGAEYYEKGRAALYGTDGTEINLEEAYNNFEQAKELGNTDANFYLGLLCDEYNYPKQDFEASKAYYEACEENPYAQLALAFLYMDGQGVKKDEIRAEEMFRSVIAQGCAEGYLGTASFAAREGDYATALDDYSKVLEGTEQFYIADAMYYIGGIYQYGFEVALNHAQALEWYEKAADLGSTAAMCNIGWMYEEGVGVPQDFAKALEWYEKAADLGNTAAMCNIGWMYKYGLGVEQDDAKALEWYKMAADLGNTYVMFDIGLMYEEGDGVEQDYAKALEWYEKAAELGDEDAKDKADEMRELLTQ